MVDEAATAPAISLDPFEAGFASNPYDQYRRLREAEPVLRTPFGPWLLTRWADVHQLLRNPTTSVEDRNATGAELARQEAFAAVRPDQEMRGSKAILNIDPPDHDRLRRLVSRAFTPRTIERLRPRVQGLVDGLLDDVAEKAGGAGGPGGSAGAGEVDLISTLAFPLPFAVISEMLGMPEGNRDELREWSHTLTQVIDPILAMLHMEDILEASDRINEVVTDAIAWKRTRPDDDDLLNALIRADDDGDVLTDDELVDNVVLLYLAGHETTVNLIGNG
ncbi:MAG TPA: cytochrome P450, partial [Acidimicrobiales bacterium]